MTTSLSGVCSWMSLNFAANWSAGTHLSSTKTLPSCSMATLSCLAPCGILSGWSVSGSATAWHWVSSGVTTMKMISSTRQTSTSGVTLMSALTALWLSYSKCLSPDACCTAGPLLGRLLLDEEVDQLRRGVGHLHLEALEDIGEVVEQPRGRNGHAETEGGGDEGPGNTLRHRTDTARARQRHALERVDDADDGSEQADEGGRRRDRRQTADALLEVRVDDQRLALDGPLGRLDHVV